MRLFLNIHRGKNMCPKHPDSPVFNGKCSKCYIESLELPPLPQSASNGGGGSEGMATGPMPNGANAAGANIDISGGGMSTWPIS